MYTLLFFYPSVNQIDKLIITCIIIILCYATVCVRKLVETRNSTNDPLHSDHYLGVCLYW